MTVLEYNDLLDRLTKVTFADGGTTNYFYSDTPVFASVETRRDKDSPNDQAIRSLTKYDGLGRVIQTQLTSAPEGIIYTDTTYDALGRKHTVSNPYRSTSDETYGITTFGYDGLSRLETAETTDRFNTSTGVVRTDYQGNATTVTDQAGKPRRSLTDALGRLIRVDEPDKTTGALGDVTSPVQPTSYSYDALDDLTTVNQGGSGGQYRIFNYDSLKRLTRATNPESGTVSYTYDDNANVTTRTDARGVVTCYGTWDGTSCDTRTGYDALNRLQKKTYSDSTPGVTYTYDDSSVSNSKGRLTQVSSAMSTTNYFGYDSQGRVTGGYDALGRITASSQVTNGQTYVFAYGYNLAGGMTSETYPSGQTVSTGYDTAGLIDGVTGSGNKTYASSFTYWPHGAMNIMKLGDATNSLWEHAKYQSRLQPTEIGLGTSGTDSSILRLAYSYNTTGQNDNNGNVLTQTISVGATSMNQKYEYDALNRLKKIGENNDLWWYTYEYDQYGNRIGGQRSDSPFLPPLLIPGIDHTKNRISDTSYVYDNAGNLTHEPTANGQYSYDAENRMLSASGNSGSGTYSYDGDGRRVMKTANSATTVFVYNAMGQLVAEYCAGQCTGTGGTRFLTADHLGSTRVVTDSSGTVISRHDYLPFGETIPAGIDGRTGQGGMGYEDPDGINQKFTGKERDAESGLDYFGARYYGSNMGRWTSPDWSLLPVPIPYADLRNPQSLNLYSYINNNPILAADPDGHRDPTEEEKKRLQEAQQKLAIQVGDKQAAAAIADVNTAIAAVPDGASDPAGLGAAMSALNNLGSTEYAFDADLPDNGYTGSYGPRTDKCNVFVAEQYANGAGVGWDGVRGYPTNQTLLGSNYPPIANDLGDKNKSITGLAVVGGGQTTPSSARVGDVVGFHAQAAGREGHSAIFVGGNVVVYAGSSIVKANTVGGTVRGLAQQGHQIDQVTWRRLVPQ